MCNAIRLIGSDKGIIFGWDDPEFLQVERMANFLP